MTPRQRYRETILFGNPDKIPMSPGWPRESTLKVWRNQGLPEGVDYFDAVAGTLGIDKNSLLKRQSIDVSFKMIPEFEVKVLEHNEGHYVIRDWMGAITEISDQFDESYLRTAKDFVTRKWHKFPVETREDWEEMKKRFDPETPERMGNKWVERYLDSMKNEYVTTLSINGVFWQLREWCGFENLCVLMCDEPEFVHEMAVYWTDFVSRLLDRVLLLAPPDCIYISEDMAFKAHSMISPAMTREFILPAYKKWIPAIKKGGCPIIELDSDGYIEELIPIWIEAGINCCSPIEVAAHCDILKFRKMFGKNIAYMQGIDKRIMATGGKELEDHIMGIVPPMFEQGGFIPGCDHGVPTDVSWQNYLEHCRLLAKLSGWL